MTYLAIKCCTLMHYEVKCRILPYCVIKTSYLLLNLIVVVECSRVSCCILLYFLIFVISWQIFSYLFNLSYTLSYLVVSCFILSYFDVSCCILFHFVIVVIFCCILSFVLFCHSGLILLTPLWRPFT